MFRWCSEAAGNTCLHALELKRLDSSHTFQTISVQRSSVNMFALLILQKFCTASLSCNWIICWVDIFVPLCSSFVAVKVMPGHWAYPSAYYYLFFGLVFVLFYVFFFNIHLYLGVRIILDPPKKTTSIVFCWLSHVPINKPTFQPASTLLRCVVSAQETI